MPVRIWGQKGRGVYRDLVTSFRNSFLSFRIMPDGRLAAATWDGWGFISLHGRAQVNINAAADFRDRALSLDRQGGVVGFTLDYPNGSPWRFELAGRRLVQTASPALRRGPDHGLRSGHQELAQRVGSLPEREVAGDSVPRDLPGLGVPAGRSGLPVGGRVDPLCLRPHGSGKVAQGGPCAGMDGQCEWRWGRRDGGVRGWDAPMASDVRWSGTYGPLCSYN